MTTALAFSRAPRVAALPEREVHVFRAGLDLEEECLRRLEKTLDPEETSRAARFRFPQHRARFIAAHGLLRSLLAAYLGVEPAGIGFTRTRYGKPALDRPPPGPHLKFNMSHSEGLALFAFAWDLELGIDLEFCKAAFPFLDVARDVFTPREFERLRSLPPGRMPEHFFRVWTCKEAFLKAAGKGLSLAPGEIEVSLEGAPSIRPRGEPPAGSKWPLFELDPAVNYRGALVVSENPAAVRCYERPAITSG